MGEGTNHHETIAPRQRFPYMFGMHCAADGCTQKGPRFFKREAKAAITTCSPLWGAIGKAPGSEKNGKQKGRGKPEPPTNEKTD